MDPRLQAGVELQLEKQAQQAHDASLSGVLGRHFKQGGLFDLPGYDPEAPVEGSRSTQAEIGANKERMYKDRQDIAQTKADAKGGTLEVPPAQRGEVSVQAEREAAKAALAAAKEDQARRDAGTLEVPAATDRDRLMKELPPHLQNEPKGGPGNPSWEYWNTMVLLELEQRRRNPKPRVLQPGDIGHAGNAPAGDFPLPMNIPPGGNPNL